MNELRMSAYYYCFDKTGDFEIDKILSAVACAGKAFHYTSDWNDECSYAPEHHIGKTPIEWIQNAANEAAQKRREGETSDIDELHREIEGTIALPQPSPLTREQVRIIADKIRNEYIWKHEVNYWLDTDAALRLTLTQQAQRIAELEDQWRKTNAQYESAAKAVTRQAQEVERLKGEGEYERMRLAACSDAALSNSPLEPDHLYYSASYGDVLRMRHQLEAALTAMTTERDAAVGRIEIANERATLHPSWREKDKPALLDALAFQGGMTKVLLGETDELRQQLAASQARCRELEAKRQYHMDHINRLAAVTNTLGEKSETAIDSAIATLAAREADIEKLKLMQKHSIEDECEAEQRLMDAGISDYEDGEHGDYRGLLTQIDVCIKQRDAAVQEAGRLRDILQAIVSANERGQGLPFQAAMQDALLALHVRYDTQRATGSSGGAVCHAKP